MAKAAALFNQVLCYLLYVSLRTLKDASAPLFFPSPPLLAPHPDRDELGVPAEAGVAEDVGQAAPPKRRQHRGAELHGDAEAGVGLVGHEMRRACEMGIQILTLGVFQILKEKNGSSSPHCILRAF